MQKNLQDEKKKVLIALKKARSSVDRTISAIESGGACFDVIQQNLSAIGLLKSANTLMLEHHIAQSIDPAQKKSVSKKELAQIQQELVRIIRIAQNK